MTIDAHAEEWEARYQAGKTGWDRGEPNPALQQWMAEGALQPCRILVPGAGRGHEAVALARAGFDVTTVDVSPTPVQTLEETLKSANLAGTVIQANLLDWHPAEPFDAIYEQTCLCALDPTHWSDYTQRLHGWLRPGGQLFALFMQTHSEGGPPYHCDISEMARLFDSRYWQWPKAPARQVPHPSGRHELATVLTKR